MSSLPMSAAFFAAHPDDVELFGGGLLLALKDAGWDIHFVIATDGARADGEPDQDLARRRAREAADSAAQCGAHLHLLGFPDGALALQGRASREFAEVYSAIDPALCLTHHAADYHPDHREVCRLTCQTVGAGRALLLAEAIFGFGPMPDLIFDITETFSAKSAALACHRSQKPDQMIEGLKIWNRFRGMQLFSAEGTMGEAYCLPRDTVLRPSPLTVLPETVRFRQFPGGS